MTPSTAIRTALALSAAFAAAPALADLSAEDVWSSWQETMAGTGQTIEVADLSRSGSQLTLSGITATLAAPDGGVTTRIEQIVFSEQGDGSVSIDVSPKYDMRIETVDEAGDDVVIEMALTHSDLEITASGDPDAISYDFTAPRLELNLGDVMADGKPIDMSLAMAIDGLDGDYLVKSGMPQTITSKVAAGAMALTLSVNDPEEDLDMDLAMTMQDIASQSTGTMSALSADGDLSAMLRDGMTSDGQITYGPMSYKVDATSTTEGQVIIEGSAEAGSFDFALNGDGLSYGGGNQRLAVSVLAPGAMIPPIAFDIAETYGKLAMPLLAGTDSQEFGLVMRLSGLTVGDMLWAMIDPTGGLPRDPANLTIDISGKGVLTGDLFDPEAMAEFDGSDEMPGELESVTINALELSLAGAELTGSGAFTFNNDTMPPMPAGAVNLMLVGANGLIDKLISIGLLPEDQAMGARMMLGMFARPGDGQDTLVSTIEVKEDGAVIANGQRIR